MTNVLTYDEVLDLILTPKTVVLAVAMAANAIDTEVPVESFEFDVDEGVAALPFVFATIKEHDPEFDNMDRYAAMKLTATYGPDEEPSETTLASAITNMLRFRVVKSVLEDLCEEE